MSKTEIEKRAIRSSEGIHEVAIDRAYQFLDQAVEALKSPGSKSHSAFVVNLPQLRADEVVDAMTIIANKDQEYWGVIIHDTNRRRDGSEVIFRTA